MSVDSDISERFTDSDSALCSERDNFWDDSSDEGFDFYWSEGWDYELIIYNFLASP